MEEERQKREGLAPEWGYAAIIFIFLLLVGIVLLIPTETVDFGNGRPVIDYTYTYQPYGVIGWALIGMSWIAFLWPVYKYIFTKMPKAYGEPIGEGISRGLRKGKVCPECNTINDFDFKICPECGYHWPAGSSA